MPNRLKTFSNYKVKGDKFLKNAKQHFLLPILLEKAKNMPKYDVHAKQHFFMPNPWASEGFFPGQGASKGFSQNYFQGGAQKW